MTTRRQVSVMPADRISTRTESESVIEWRTERLVEAGLPMRLARKVAADCAYNLRSVLGLVDRGCPVRILAPLDRRCGPC
jgi:hypothetical protein